MTSAKRMARYLFLVSRDHASLYDDLVDRFRDDRNVEVILDRRRGERRAEPSPHPVEERRRMDRRTRREIDAELRTRSHVILTLPDDDPRPQG